MVSCLGGRRVQSPGEAAADSSHFHTSVAKSHLFISICIPCISSYCSHPPGTKLPMGSRKYPPFLLKNRAAIGFCFCNPFIEIFLHPHSLSPYPQFPANHFQLCIFPLLFIQVGKLRRGAVNYHIPEQHPAAQAGCTRPRETLLRKEKGCLSNFPRGKAAGAKLPLPKWNRLQQGTLRL